MDARVSSSRAAKERQRRKNKKKAAAAEEPSPTGPATIHDLPDDLLKLILLRLDSSVWLIRAASVCNRWRVIIGGGDFLLLSRALHPPAIAGHFHLGRAPTEFVPSSPPSPVTGSRFSSLDFLPGGKARWEVADCHGGLVLLRKPNRWHPDMIVCDPLTRRHQGIIHPRRFGYSFTHASLLNGDGGGGGDAASMSNFRVVVFYASYGGGPGACVFTTAEDGDWRVLGKVGDDLDGDDFTAAHVAGRLDGALCMGFTSGRVIILDNASLVFTRVNLPSCKDPSSSVSDGCSTFRVVYGSGVGTEPQTARIVHVNSESLEVFRRVRHGGGGDQWQWVLERSIQRLSEATRGLPGYPEEDCLDWIVEVVAGGAGFVVLVAVDCGPRWVFSVDVETMEMAVVQERTYRGDTRPYTLPWPPLLQACLGQNRRRRR